MCIKLLGEPKCGPLCGVCACVCGSHSFICVRLGHNAYHVLTLERSLRSKNCFEDFSAIIEEYFEMGHAEPVPLSDLELPCNRVFYLPMHAVVKESSSTTKIRAVFDTSAKSSLNVSLNDLLLVGPTVHSSLVDVLIRFQQHRIALTTDVSRMYRAVLLPAEERDLHRSQLK